MPITLLIEIAADGATVTGTNFDGQELADLFSEPRHLVDHHVPDQV